MLAEIARHRGILLRSLCDRAHFKVPGWRDFMKKAVQGPSCKDDDQPAIEPSRAELHVHGPDSSTGRLSMM